MHKIHIATNFPALETVNTPSQNTNRNPNPHPKFLKTAVSLRLNML